MVFRLVFPFVAAAILSTTWSARSADTAPFYPVGKASVDVTPNYPVRLSGYAARKTESEGVAQKIWVKALAIGTDEQGPALLVAVDNVGVPRHLRDNLVSKLTRTRHLKPENITVCSTHTHSAPCLEGSLRNLFLETLPDDQQQRISRYTAELEAAMEKAALAALDARQPVKLTHGRGQAAFAANRRTPGGPVDHDLPALFAHDKDGNLVAVMASYACHCTTLTGEFNRICGDWAGYAREQLESEHPGTTVVMVIGCGADSNPDPRPGWDLAKQHGSAIAAGVNRALTNATLRVSGDLRCRAREIKLPFDTLPTREHWEALASTNNPPGKHARMNLARLDKGEKLPEHLDYLVQTWQFGDSLAFVFLPGEVVVDYSLRLKKELDPARTWINAYANDVPCYIPSERILKEGGYEGGYAMIYYDLPTRFAVGIEDRIVGTIRDLLPRSLRTAHGADSK